MLETFYNFKTVYEVPYFLYMICDTVIRCMFMMNTYYYDYCIIDLCTIVFFYVCKTMLITQKIYLYDTSIKICMFCDEE